MATFMKTQYSFRPTKNLGSRLCPEAPMIISLTSLKLNVGHE